MSDPTKADSTDPTPPETVQEPVALVAEAEVAAQEPEPVMDVVVVEPLVIRTLEDRVPVGSTFTRTAFGWSVKIMYGGSLRLSGDGQTMDNALTDAGV